MWRFFGIFVGLLVVLFMAELSWPVQHGLVQPWTATLARIAAALLQLLDPGVLAEGKVLRHAGSGAGISIEAGCNGVEACLMLVAALVAYPARWSSRLLGIGIGLVAIQAVNLLRVITLFYLADWNMRVFEFAHLYLWQALIMLDVLVVWLLWMRWIARTEPGAELPLRAVDAARVV